MEKKYWEDKEYAYCTYELSEKDLKKLNLISNEYETLPLSETDMEKAIVECCGK